MFKRRTLKILAFIVAGYVLLLILGFFRPAYFESSAGYLTLVPYLSLHLFHKVGVPGLLEHNGACGWGWCAPTASGLGFLVAVWVLFAWSIAWGVAALMSRFAAR